MEEKKNSKNGTIKVINFNEGILYCLWNISFKVVNINSNNYLNMFFFSKEITIFIIW